MFIRIKMFLADLARNIFGNKSEYRVRPDIPIYSETPAPREVQEVDPQKIADALNTEE